MARTQPRPKKRMTYVPWIEQLLFLTDKDVTLSYVHPRDSLLRNHVCHPPDIDHTVVNKNLSPWERERLAKIIAIPYSKEELEQLNDTTKVYLGIMRAGIDHQEKLSIKIAKCCKSTFKIHMAKVGGTTTESILLSREYLWDFLR